MQKKEKDNQKLIIKKNQSKYWIDHSYHKDNFKNLLDEIMRWLWEKSILLITYNNEETTIFNNQKKLFSINQQQNFNNVKYLNSREHTLYSNSIGVHELYLTNAEVENLKLFLRNKGWDPDVIYKNTDCPCFLDANKENSQIVVFASLLTWNSINQKEQKLITNKFESKGFKYFINLNRIKNKDIKGKSINYIYQISQIKNLID